MDLEARIAELSKVVREHREVLLTEDPRQPDSACREKRTFMG